MGMVATRVERAPAKANVHPELPASARSVSKAPQSVHKVLQREGKPLEPTIRSAMETRFQHDFSRVRIHTDTAASASARDVNALAYTVGRNIVFARDQYLPATQQGQQLLAHELAHVVQQNFSPSLSPAEVEVAPPADMREADADRMAAMALSAAPTKASAGTGRDASGRNDRAVLQRAVSLGAGLGLLGGGMVAGGLVGLLAGGPIGALVGALAGAAAVGVGLLIEHVVDDKSKPSTEGKPDVLDDPKIKTIFDAKLREGLEILHTQQKGCAFPHDSHNWRYDEERWKAVPTPGKIGESEYRYNGSGAAEAVDALFEHLDKWDCDCAMYTEIATLYAMRHALGTAEFNRRFPDMRLRPHGSAGVPRETVDAPVEEEGGPEAAKDKQAFDRYWVDSPVGTEVSWRNISGQHEPAWQFEHAIKVVKGGDPSGAGDRYDAHPISLARHEQGKSTELTEDEIKQGMAQHSKDAPTKFIPTAATWQELRDAGVSADVIGTVQAAKIEQLRTRNALADWIKTALKGVDPSTKRTVFVILSSTSEGVDEAYIRENIVRNNVARLHLPATR
jgi:Domain of unknown function (DUF4157)